MKKLLLFSTIFALLLVGLAIASFVLVDDGFKYDTDNDNWIILNHDECLFWMENYGIPAVISTEAGEPDQEVCFSQTLQKFIPCENQFCKVTAANYAIALAKRNYELLSPTTTIVSTTTPATTTTQGTTMPYQCHNTDESCGIWPDCQDLSGDDICNAGGVYYDYWCQDNVPMITSTCIDSCCKSWFGSNSTCEGNECVYGEGDTATTTTPMSGPGEYFLEQGQTVTCPTSGYEYCRIEFYRVSDDKLFNSWIIPLGDSRTTSSTYYYKLYGVVE